jgi:DNA repair exonuclease SbcCD nuclease subunit
MQVAWITDLHFGARNDHPVFNKHIETFYTETFFPHLRENGIKDIFMMGDTFERRKYINFHTLYQCRKYYFDVARDEGINIHIIPGNHDTYFKNTNEVNSPRLLLNEYENIIQYHHVTDVKVGNSTFCFVPWITKENEDEFVKAIKASTADVCLGHFEFTGYKMHRDTINPHGMAPSVVDHFPLVISGHFHHRHSKGNITYMGNPYEITWSDYGDTRGFAVFDCDTKKMEYVNNPVKIHHKVYYNDTEESQHGDPMETDFESLKNGCVKVYVEKKSDLKKYDKFMDKIDEQDPIDVKPVEDLSEEFERGDEHIDVEDTMTILKDYVDEIEITLNKDEIKNRLQTLHIEALEIL